MSFFNSDKLSALLSLIGRAGDEILKVYSQLESDWEVSLKKDRTPVTEADRASNRILSDGLMKLWPDVPILSEESQEIPYDVRKKFEYFWLLDPLDGTREFLKRNGEFTINLALIHRTRAVAGFISVPCKGLIYYAIKGEGAYRMEEIKGAEQKENKETVGKETLGINTGITKPDFDNNKTDQSELARFTVSKLEAARFSLNEPGLTVVASRSHFDPAIKEFIEQLNNPRLVSVGSSLKFMLLAEGRAHLYPRLGRTMEWDTAAGQAILEEAGGQVLEFSTRLPLTYNKESLENPPFLASGQVNEKN
ncbi:MAG: 3'(2'),5'-bisphosphate nucleotidase CysQ family protein [Candidatus Saccharicenans sp.]|uniref:3'(2'),5'-bisphosphate nucleotidase CysQ family protein n=1 Tax=Candidatus Saccharicenans sp. TaxID=2819258 RepID=UPI0040494CC0